jgi:arginyl-tRNA synthetase
VLRRKSDQIDETKDYMPNEKETGLIKLMNGYREIISEAAETLNPSLVANFMYELAKDFNQFYHDYSILSAEENKTKNFRIRLTAAVGQIIYSGMNLLGIEVPERM